jgi:hypothetical protein
MRAFHQDGKNDSQVCRETKIYAIIEVELEPKRDGP